MMASAQRLTRRALGLCLGAGALLLATLIPAFPASAAPPRQQGSWAGSNYLALGDSVAFGYVPPQAKPPPNYNNPKSFVGYPEDLGRALRLHTVNASCPGETTISMLAAGGQSNGCENSIGSPIGYRTLFPLHVKYSGTQTAFAVNYLEHHSTRLVTIDIGANDGFVCQETTADHCTSGPELTALIAQIEGNLTTIYQQLRDVAHYHGRIVALTYYSTDYANTLTTLEVELLNSAIVPVTKHFGGTIANGFEAFKVASKRFGGSPCRAGLLIKLPGGACNIHPSPTGHLVLAAAIAQAIGAN